MTLCFFKCSDYIVVHRRLIGVVFKISKDVMKLIMYIKCKFIHVIYGIGIDDRKLHASLPGTQRKGI
jgi:hypothetical protein